MAWVTKENRIIFDVEYLCPSTAPCLRGRLVRTTTRQFQKLHIAWARHMLDNRELVVGGGTQPSTEPARAGGLDGSAAAEERDNFHRDAHMNDRNHASGAPRPGCE